jgi:diaminohydroxyphosphoribosylaminopyrimidine deaminase/5-amino-6-(5-phosphoribosylamino)uracil reductase
MGEDIVFPELCTPKIERSGFFILEELMKSDRSTDIDYMKLALRLAVKGAGHTSPNPLVGAIIVKDGKIVGKGYHRRFGGPHAEVYALREAKKNARGATLYVNLEPCSHYGKTPPCVDQLIRAGIARVVIANKDPNPLVNGEGIRKLRDAGVEVITGILEEESRTVNRFYFKAVEKGWPYVILKWAQTVDGRIATASGEAFWITGEQARRDVHRLRAQVDAVLVGAGTVLRDDPKLTVRLVRRAKQPWRLVLDGTMRAPATAALFTDEVRNRTVVFTSQQNGPCREKLQQQGCRVVALPPENGGHVNLRDVLSWCRDHQIVSLLVEGGRQVLTEFLRLGLADEVVVYIAPKILGAGVEAIGDLGVERLAHAKQLQDIRWEKIGQDMKLTAKL